MKVGQRGWDLWYKRLSHFHYAERVTPRFINMDNDFYLEQTTLIYYKDKKYICINCSTTISKQQQDF